MATVSLGRDRLGHSLVVAAIALASMAPAPTQSYRAQRFDVNVAVHRGGDLRVEETIIFQFERGTFTRVWRDIPITKTDGIQFVEATLDGLPVPLGSGPGHVMVSGRTTVRVQWQLEPTGPSVHTFGLTYVAHGVGWTERGRDLVEWQPLPTEHVYSIDATRVVFHTAETPIEAPSLRTRRVDQSSITVENHTVTASARGIESNGWISAGLAFPEGSLVASQPRWMARREAQSRAAPRWIMAAAAVFAGGLVLLLLARAGYRSPAPTAQSAETAPPEALPPAITAALVGRGEPRTANAMATLLDLAGRGVITVHELPRTLGVRNFALTQIPGNYHLRPHEEMALRLAFAERGDDVSLARARSRLARRGRSFCAAIADEMIADGLLDPERRAVRVRLTVISGVLMAVGVVGTIAMIPLVAEHGGWALLVGPALVVAGITGLFMAVGTSALTDEGARQAARWRGFRRHLKAVVASGRDESAPPAPAAWAIYAATFGLGYYWARYLKRHPGSVPGWFAALDPSSADAAYVAFIGSAGAQGHGAGAGGGSGAAGGGASGAA